MEDVFDMVDSRDVQQSSETGGKNFILNWNMFSVDNLRKLWRFFKATESNYVSFEIQILVYLTKIKIMQAFPRHDGNFESVSKRSAGQKVNN